MQPSDIKVFQEVAGGSSYYVYPFSVNAGKKRTASKGFWER